MKHVSLGGSGLKALAGSVTVSQEDDIQGVTPAPTLAISGTSGQTPASKSGIAGSSASSVKAAPTHLIPTGAGGKEKTPKVIISFADQICGVSSTTTKAAAAGQPKNPTSVQTKNSVTGQSKNALAGLSKNPGTSLSKNVAPSSGLSKNSGMLHIM